MPAVVTFDIETAAIDRERLEDFKHRFEPKPPEPEPAAEVEEEKPKKKKKLAKKEDRPKKLKSDRAGLHYLTGRVVCAGAKNFGKKAEMFAHEEEEILLAGLYEYLDNYRPFTLVTFNGREFDVPFVYMRGLLHGFDFSQVLPMDKFSKSHIDLYQHLGGKWGMNGKLSELAWHFGIEDGLDGSGADVQKNFDNGNWEEIIAHCRADVETTEKLYIRLFPHGRIVSGKWSPR